MHLCDVFQFFSNDPASHEPFLSQILSEFTDLLIFYTKHTAHFQSAKSLDKKLLLFFFHCKVILNIATPNHRVTALPAREGKDLSEMKKDPPSSSGEPSIVIIS